MSLERCNETRLLEAVLTETKNCFTDSARASASAARVAQGYPAADALGLDARYSSNGTYRFFARPFRANESIVPCQVNITPEPPTYEPGVGDASDTLYNVAVTFTFPWDLIDFTPGENTFLDHLAAFREWITTGGSWPNKTLSLQDPDNVGESIGTLKKIAQEGWESAPRNAGVFVPVVLSYEIREGRRGNIV